MLGRDVKCLISDYHGSGGRIPVHPSWRHYTGIAYIKKPKAAIVSLTERVSGSGGRNVLFSDKSKLLRHKS